MPKKVVIEISRAKSDRALRLAVKACRDEELSSELEGLRRWLQGSPKYRMVIDDRCNGGSNA